MKITIYLFFIGILFLSGCGDAVDFIYNKDIPCARIVVYAFIEGDSLVRAGNRNTDLVPLTGTGYC